MATPRWAIAIGAILLLASPGWAAAGSTENLDFRLSVESIAWTSSGFVVKTQIENRTGSPDLFLHHEANRDDPEAFSFTPPAEESAAAAPRKTFTLKGLTSSRSAATLAFGVKADEEAGLLIVGETRPPYRQVAIALKPLLPERPAPTRAPEPAATPVEAKGDRLEPGVIRNFVPPHPSLGPRIVLKEGTAGPRGEGWSRIYTELPDISLDELGRVLESPAQIWRGETGFLYLRNVGGRRALAVDVRNGEVISARYITPETLGQALGPKTRYPKRVYMGRP